LGQARDLERHVLRLFGMTLMVGHTELTQDMALKIARLTLLKA
jgi:hypothetical protein